MKTKMSTYLKICKLQIENCSGICLYELFVMSLFEFLRFSMSLQHVGDCVQNYCNSIAESRAWITRIMGLMQSTFLAQSSKGVKVQT